PLSRWIPRPSSRSTASASPASPAQPPDGASPGVVVAASPCSCIGAPLCHITLCSSLVLGWHTYAAADVTPAARRSLPLCGSPRAPRTARGDRRRRVYYAWCLLYNKRGE